VPEFILYKTNYLRAYKEIVIAIGFHCYHLEIVYLQ